jgi:hypothetical protein
LKLAASTWRYGSLLQPLPGSPTTTMRAPWPLSEPVRFDAETPEMVAFTA